MIFKNHVLINGIEHKKCSGCKTFKVLESFNKNTVKHDGLHNECLECKRKRDKRYAQKNKEKIQQYKKDYRIKNREILTIKGKAYFEENKEVLLEKQREYNKRLGVGQRMRAYGLRYRKNNAEILKIKDSIKYFRNKDKIRERMIAYRKEYYKRPESKEKRRLGCNKYRAKKRSLAKDFSVKQWENCKRYFDNNCCYCEKKKRLTQDHFIPLSGGGEYTINNIVPACLSCNSSKQNRDFFDWYPRQKFYSKEREQKILKYLNYDPKEKTQQLALTC